MRTFGYGELAIVRQVRHGRCWLEVPVRVIRDDGAVLITYVPSGAPFAFPDDDFRGVNIPGGIAAGGSATGCWCNSGRGTRMRFVRCGAVRGGGSLGGTSTSRTRSVVRRMALTALIT